MVSERLHQFARRHYGDAAKRYGLLPLRQAMDGVNSVLDRELRSAEKEAGAVCARGCDHCCHRPIPCTNLEAAMLASEAELWDEEKLTALKERLAAYEAVTRMQRVNPPVMMRATCPLLENHECLLYDLRPLVCQGQSSSNANDCAAWNENPEWGKQIPMLQEPGSRAAGAGHGQMEGLADAGGKPGMLELGLALKYLLENPDMVDLSARDASKIEVAEWGIGLRHVPSDPPGPRPFHRETVEMVRQLQFSRPEVKGLLPEPGMDARRALMTLHLPIGYESEDELLEARARCDRAMDRLNDLDFDSAQVFSALGQFEVFSLPYQCLVDRDMYAKLGAFLTKHSRRALPDITSPIAPKRGKGKLKVGLVSSCFRNHQATRWCLGFLKKPIEDLETYVFHLEHEYDAYTDEWRRRGDHFFQLLGSLPEAGRFIKSLDLDVLIVLDPQERARSKQLSTLRLAPLQITMWGTPHTSGFPELTHYLSSDAMEPENGQDHYTEELIRLPGFGYCYERRMIANAIPFDRSVLGPGKHALIGQNMLKLLPRRDEMFKRVADELGTPLILIDAKDRATQRVKDRFEKAGIPTRWLEGMSQAEFSGLLAAVDMSLDTPDWNGSNTTLEALLEGTPVITVPGIHMRGRHTMGLYKAMGAAEMIAADVDDYVKRAANADEWREKLNSFNVESLFDDESATEFFWNEIRALARP